MKIISDNLYIFLSNHSDLSEVDKTKMKYTLEFIFGTFSKLLILFLISCIFGKGIEFIYASISLYSIRTFTGGLDFKTYAGCLSFTAFFFISVICIATYIPLQLNFVIVSNILVMLVFLFIAPIPAPTRPIYSKRKIRQFRTLGIIAVIFHFSMYYILDNSQYFTISIWVFIFLTIQLIFAKGVKLYADSKKKFQ